MVRMTWNADSWWNSQSSMVPTVILQLLALVQHLQQRPFFLHFQFPCHVSLTKLTWSEHEWALVWRLLALHVFQNVWEFGSLGGWNFSGNCETGVSPCLCWVLQQVLATFPVNLFAFCFGKFTWDWCSSYFRGQVPFLSLTNGIRSSEHTNCNNNIQ